MESANRDLATKLTQLQITRDKTEAALGSRNGNCIKRHRDSPHAVVSSVERAKRKVEELKIAAHEEIADIHMWGEKMESDLADVDDDMERISQLSKIDQEQVDKTRKGQLAFEKELCEQKLQYNKQLEVSNADQNTSHVGNQNGKKGAAAKLPKAYNYSLMAISSIGHGFGGNSAKGSISLTWLLFLNFLISRNSPIPKSGKPSMGCHSLSYRYERAKVILCERYGNASEVEKAYVKDILDLPKISGNQPRKIHQFYERLWYDVQSLEIKGKLSQVNGNVALTIDKLSGIRGHLVRNDENWQTWDFLNCVMP